MRSLYIRSLFLALCVAGPLAMAAPITFVYSGTASGTLGGTPFTNAAFNITALGDTANIAPWPSAGNGPQLTHSSATAQIAGFSLVTFTSATHTWRSNASQNGGLGLNLGLNILTLNEPSFVNYGLNSPIGPILESTPEVQVVNIGTSGGTLRITGSSSFSFQAVQDSTSVPEPSTAATVLLALAGLMTMRKSRSGAKR